MNADLYATLGVSRNATSSDIKYAYRKLALKHHPDQNKNDPLATVRFRRIKYAYDILSNSQKRAAYDRYCDSRPQPGDRQNSQQDTSNNSEEATEAAPDNRFDDKESGDAHEKKQSWKAQPSSTLSYGWLRFVPLVIIVAIRLFLGQLGPAPSSATANQPAFVSSEIPAPYFIGPDGTPIPYPDGVSEEQARDAWIAAHNSARVSPQAPSTPPEETTVIHPSIAGLLDSVEPPILPVPPVVAPGHKTTDNGIPHLSCMLLTAHFYALPPRVLPSIQRVDGGSDGLVRPNKDGSADLGVMQVNTLWVPLIAQVTRQTPEITTRRLINDPCFSIAAGGAIFRQYLTQAHGVVMVAVGLYGLRDLSDPPARNQVKEDAYRAQVMAAAASLFVSAGSGSGTQSPPTAHQGEGSGHGLIENAPKHRPRGNKPPLTPTVHARAP